MDTTGMAYPKPKTRKQVKAKAKRAQRAKTAEVRAYVFEREKGLCRCCRVRGAESMHEIRPRSLGGKVSQENSIAVCGSGTTGCHGYLQRHEVSVDMKTRGAEAALTFKARTLAAILYVRPTPPWVAA